ncbi:MAG: hypothetical protein QOK28_1996 [Actinomycetota bacterium]|jgi:hypothetical protein
MNVSPNSGFARLPATTAIAVVRHTTPFPEAAVLGRVRRAFAPSFGGHAPPVARTSIGAALSVVVVGSPNVADDGGFVWGTAIGESGDATDTELRRAIDDPGAAKDLLGRFVIGAPTAEDTFRLVTTPEMVHTLKRANGPHGEAFASSGFLAALLAGSGLAVRGEVVGEFLVAGFVLGRDELLDGVDALDEAVVVDVSSGGASAKSYWSVEERLAGAAPAGAVDLWELTAHNMGRVFRASSTRLGLTAGRDSNLIAAAARNAAPRCFTFGPADAPDVRGAAAVARAGGLEYTRVFRTPKRASMRLVRGYSPWTEGACTAQDLVGAAWEPQLPATTFVTGHGGEIGRAFYWKTRTDRDVAGFAAGFGDVLPDEWRASTRARVAEEVGRYTQLGSAATALDAFYTRNRVRKWTCRGLRRDEFIGTVHGFGDPASVRLLINVPEQQRRDGSFFDQALALDPLGLNAVARAAVAAAFAPAPPTTGSVRRLMADTALHDLMRLSAQATPNSFVRDLYGSRWIGQVVRRALRPDPAARRLLWNVLAVEGLHQACVDAS